jgi:hypothetical protein
VTAGARAAPAARSGRRAGTVRAFGLDLDLGFPVHGLAPAAAAPSEPLTAPGRHVRFDLQTRSELASVWPEEGATRLSDRRDPAGRSTLSIDWHPQAGYLMRGRRYGWYLISADHLHVACAPVRIAAWRWQRYLLGQVIPFMAVLHGLEVLHASAVVLDGGAVAVVGGSGAGKSSLRAHLALRGGRFLTDDVLAIETVGDVVVAHAGAKVASVRHDFLATLSPTQLAALGRPVGGDDDSRGLVVDSDEHAAPLRVVYFLHRGSGRDSAARIDPVSPGDPRLLLASTYNFVIRTPERLRAQLDVCAELAQSAACFQVHVPAGVGAAAVGALVHEHATEALRA